jgi:protein O-mannosyl-transferase
MKNNKKRISKTDKIVPNTDGFRIKNHYVYLLIIILGIIIYANSSNVPFQYDDEIRILENTKIQKLSDINTIWNQNKRRFFGYLTIAVNYHIGQEKVFGYHIFNLFIHLVASLTVYILVNLLFQTPRLLQKLSEKEKQYISTGTALIFLCHPLQTQSVTYVIQRFTSISALCLFAVFFFYVKFRLETSVNRRPRTLAVIKYYIPAILITIIGVQIKETFIVLPGALLLGEIYFFNNRKGEWPVRLIQISPFAFLVSTIL